MNIAINLKSGQLNAAIELLQASNKRKPDSIPDKCMYYLYASAMKKLLRKQIDKADETSNKPFKLSLKYEEATALYMELDNITILHDHYVANAIFIIKRMLHQKLSA